MKKTILLQINSDKAFELIKDLEALDIVKILDVNSAPKQKLSEKYAGALNLSEKEYENFQNQIQSERGNGPRIPGRLKGKVSIPDDFNDLSIY